LKTRTVNILTIFPEAVEAYTSASILKIAVEKGLVCFNTVDIRDFSDARHRKVDDTPYGGGPGMVMRVDIIVKALESLEKRGTVIITDPAGEPFDASMAAGLSVADITLICGRYAGIDSRVREFADRSVSIGPYVLSGGELAALVIAEATTRLVPGVLGDPRSLDEDRGYPLYTRPAEFRGMKVPDVLVSGDHAKIKEYRDGEAKS
jgi:tRNA (guanine37-N1)-methyltransferase